MSDLNNRNVVQGSIVTQQPTYRDDSPPDYEDFRLQKLKSFCSSNEINTQNVMKLRQLEEFEIIVVCDDSGSMSTPLDQDYADPYAKKKTRWDELCTTVSLILQLATCLDKSGVDIYFLNRQPILGVNSVQQVQSAFRVPPAGYTPSVRALSYIFQQKSSQEKKVLCVFLTDGQPTDDNGNVQLQQFVNFVKQRPQNIYLSLVACTEDEQSVSFLDGFIQANYPRLDVTEDFTSERNEVKQRTGKPFSLGDYVCKILLGPVDPSFGDKGLFSRRNQRTGDGSNNENCYCCCFYCPC